jgi:hypothetical protein
MPFLLPYYYPKTSVVHACPPDVKIAFVAIVLLACWIGVYGLALGTGYAVLGLFLVISFLALATASSTRGAVRVFLLPGVVAITWTLLYLLVEGYHAWSHLAGRATDPLTGTLAGHYGLRLAHDFRRILALFASAAAVSGFVVSTSVSDLRRSRIVPRGAVLNIELFMSMFTRFQWRVRRILYGHHLVGLGVRPARVLQRGPANPLVLAGQGLVMFVIAVLRDIPAIFNYREMKRRVGWREEA